MAQPPKLDLQPLDLQPVNEESSSNEPGLLSRGWNAISEPLTNLPSRFGRSVSDFMTNPSLATAPTGEGGLYDIAAKIAAMGKGFVGGSIEGLGNVASSLTSPLSLATLGFGGAEYGAGKLGLNEIARLASIGTKVASAPFAIHGASEVVRPSATLGERAMGVAEAAGGAAGMLHTPPTGIKPTEVKPEIKPTIEPEIKPALVDEMAGKVTPELDVQPIAEPTIPPVKPLGQLPTPVGLSQVIKAIPETGNLEFDGMVKSLRAMRRRKGIDQFNDLETQAYNGLMDKIKTSPSLPEDLRQKWNTVVPSETTPSGKLVIPTDLSGSRPRFNIGSTSYTPVFVNDLDKALFIIAQKNPSKRDADFLKLVMDATGLDEIGARAAGVSVRRMIKEQVKGQPEGIVTIQPIFSTKPPAPIPTPTKEPNITYIIRQEKATPEFVKKAQEQGYQFQGLNDRGDFKFKKTTGPVIEPIISPKQTVENQPIIPPIKPPIEAPPIEPVSPSAEPIIRRMKDTPPEQAGIIREVWNVSRGLMSVDLPFITSAGLRQGFPMIGTKAWFKAWIPSVKSYGSKAAFKAHADLLASDPLMQRGTTPVLRMDGTPLVKNGSPVLKETPSIAEQAGVVLTDVGTLTTREESIRSQLGERIPLYGHHVAANNRAYTAYINDLRLSTFRNFYEAMPDKNNMVALKELGDAANTFTGRGPLRTKVPFTGGKELSLEKYASGLAEVLFAPKLIASRLQMLNPVNYIMTNPQVRKQYVYAALRTAGAWMTFASVGKLAGAEVSLDPTNADFGKIKFGNVRFDPGAGFQQYIVFLARMASNQYTSSTTGKTQEMGVKYNSPTRGSVAQNFLTNKFHPSLKYFYDAAFASSNRQFGVFDRAVQMAVPMITGDMIDIYNEQPELLPFMAPMMSGGLGTQYYTGKDMNKPMFISPQNDIVLGGKR